MNPHQHSFFDGGRRLQMTESIELTIQSLRAYGPDHPDWGIAWSGGKDSTATMTLIIWLIDAGKVQRPRSITVFLADTRQELPPLWAVSMQIIDELRERGIEPVKKSGPHPVYIEADWPRICLAISANALNARTRKGSS